MGTETLPFDAARYLETEEDQSELLSDAFETGDPAYIAHALGIIARARHVAHGPGCRCDARSPLQGIEHRRRPEADDLAWRSEGPRHSPAHGSG